MTREVNHQKRLAALEDPVENFSDRVKGLEAKFKGTSSSAHDKKPKVF